MRARRCILVRAKTSPWPLMQRSDCRIRARPDSRSRPCHLSATSSPGGTTVVGSGKNVAHRLSSLPRAPHGAGKRRNAGLRLDLLAHFPDIDYPTVACASGGAAKAHEARFDKCRYPFPTSGRSVGAAEGSTKR